MPQLPTLVDRAPRGDAWLHEIKFDGYRLLARLTKGEARLVTRGGHDWTDRFPAIAEELSDLDTEGTLIDGEVVVLEEDGTTDFQALQNVAGGGRGGPLRFFAFDLPFYEGHDLTRSPLKERKEILQGLLGPNDPAGALRFSDHIRGHGERVYERACGLGVEGIVSKRVDASYREGRTRSWVKVKCRDRREFVIGGWTDPSGARAGLGALLLGWYDDAASLRYAGKVGTGFSADTLADLRERLDRIPATDSPFTDPPTGRTTGGVHWVRPTLVAEVEIAGRTEEGRLRHASFQGLREDKDARDVGGEEAAPARDAAREGAAEARSGKSGTKANRGGRVGGVRLTHPDRILYPEQGITKRELAEYFAAVSESILPHLVDRPLAVVRCPRGHGEACFYQKHVGEGMPEAIRSVSIAEREDTARYIAVDDTAGLVSLAQIGVLEIHPWGSRADRPDRPDRIVFDLDPGEGVGWPAVVDAARLLRDRIAALDLRCFVRSTGGKGLHLVVPLIRRNDWAEVKGFARALAQELERADPHRFIARSSRAAREGRIFVDYLRNDRGATAIASFSPRARPGAPVAVPLAWDELSPRRRSDHYSVRSVPARLARLRRDPWEGFFHTRQSLTSRRLALAGAAHSGDAIR